MQQYYITFSSITFAKSVKEQFRFSPAQILLMHTPKSIPVNGCSYSLRVKETYVREILNKAREMNINIKGVFVETQGGFQEVAQ